MRKYLYFDENLFDVCQFCPSLIMKSFAEKRRPGLMLVSSEAVSKDRGEMVMMMMMVVLLLLVLVW